MKRKSLLSLALILTIAFSMMIASTVITASAGVSVKKVSGHTYQTDYIAKCLGIDDLGEDKLYYKTSTASEYTEAGVTIEFTAKAEYVFRKGETEDISVVIDTTQTPTADDMHYAFDATTLDEYKESVASAVTTGFKTGDTYTVPSLANIFTSEFYDYTELTATVYYAAPQSSVYSSTTSSRFTCSTVGTYSFYVLYKDEYNNTVSIDDLVVGNGGWYEKDVDGNPTGDIIIPIFTFTVSEANAPEITISTAEDAFLNLEYEVESFTIVSEEYNAEYKMYWTENEINKADFATVAEYVAKVQEAGLEVTEDNNFEKQNLFNATAKTFTPVKKGYYYVGVRVVDSANNSVEDMTYAIKAIDEYKVVKPEKEVVKYNLTSIIFLSIAAVCCVAIIVLLCIKPKEEKTLNVAEE